MPSYHELHGEDFDDVLRVREPRESPGLPPYVEFVKIGPPGPTGDALLGRSRDCCAGSWDAFP